MVVTVAKERAPIIVTVGSQARVHHLYVRSRVSGH